MSKHLTLNNAYKSIFESNLDAILIINSDHDILDANPAAELLFGYSHDEIIKLNLLELVDKNKDQLSDLLNDINIKNEISLTRKDDSKFPAEIFVTHFMNENGINQNSLIIRDNTNRQQPEEIHVANEELQKQGNELLQVNKSLKESESRYRSLFETMTEGFSINEIIYDDYGNPYDIRYLDVNPAFERHTGLKKNDIIGKTRLELFPNSEETWFEEYGNVLLTGEPTHFQEWLGPLNRCFDVYAFQTEPHRFAVMFNDITEHKKSERELEKLNRTLRALSDSTRAMRYATDESEYLDEVCKIISR